MSRLARLVSSTLASVFRSSFWHPTKNRKLVSRKINSDSKQNYSENPLGRLVWSPLALGAVVRALFGRTSPFGSPSLRRPRAGHVVLVSRRRLNHCDLVTFTFPKERLVLRRPFDPGDTLPVMPTIQTKIFHRKKINIWLDSFENLSRRYLGQSRGRSFLLTAAEGAATKAFVCRGKFEILPSVSN